VPCVSEASNDKNANGGTKTTGHAALLNKLMSLSSPGPLWLGTQEINLLKSYSLVQTSNRSRIFCQDKM